MSIKPKVAIVYLLWSDEPYKYLTQALEGIAKQTYPRENLELIIVYNSHPENESSAASFIFEQIDRRREILPPTIILEQEKNLGFAGGNNVGIRFALERGFDYIFLHNADGFLDPAAIERLVKAMEEDKTIGESQPLILLHPNHHLINSAGNVLHFLGMGYCAMEGKEYHPAEFRGVWEIGYVSGAAAFLRADLLAKHGPWDEDFFLYHEDTEYSLRLRFLGYKIVLVSAAIFYHQYEFKKNTSKFYWIERNRHALKILFYKWPTLLLLSPLEVAYNAGLILTSLSGGWFKDFVGVYNYWFQRKNWQKWLAKRKKIQASRLISDKNLLQITANRIIPGKELVGGFRHILAAIIFTVYGFLLKLLVRW